MWTLPQRSRRDHARDLPDLRCGGARLRHPPPRRAPRLPLVVQFRPRDYEQLGEPTARASQPRLALPAGPRSGNTTTPAPALPRLRSSRSTTTVASRLYQFVRAERTYNNQTRDAGGLVERSFVEDPAQRKRARLSELVVTELVDPPVALAARRTTDVLTLGLHVAPAGVVINPTTPSGRATWGSLGFLLRDAAARRLDIGTDEIQVGVHAVGAGDPTSVRGEVFIADTLQNGAGYAVWLADHLGEWFDGADTLAEDYRSHATSEDQPCDSSCYRCLRDYSNRAWHPLLDWRLATDLLDLIRGRPLVVEHDEERVRRHVARFAADFGLAATEVGGVAAVCAGQRVMVVLHPFEDRGPESCAERVRRVRTVRPDVLLTTAFELVRRPGHVVGRLLSA